MARLVSSAKPSLSPPSAPSPAPAPTSPLTPPPPILTPQPVTGAPGEGGGGDGGGAEPNLLLRRGFGRAATVLTGWTGALAPNALAPRRKRLLGE